LKRGGIRKGGESRLDRRRAKGSIEKKNRRANRGKKKDSPTGKATDPEYEARSGGPGVPIQRKSTSRDGARLLGGGNEEGGTKTMTKMEEDKRNV